MRMQTKALLLKDWLVLSRQMKVFLVLIAVFSAVPVLSVSSFAIVYSAMLPYTAMAFDERDKWDRLAAMMPYRESDLVLSKYLLGYAGLAGVLAVAACSRLLLHRSLWYIHILIFYDSYIQIVPFLFTPDAYMLPHDRPQK